MSAPKVAPNKDTNLATPLQSEEPLADEDIIQVAVFVPAYKGHIIARHTKPSYIDRMKDLRNDTLISRQSSEKGKEGKLRMVNMPRREYLKYFAKDASGNYAGTEPERTWTDEELDQAFGIYLPPTKRTSQELVSNSLITELGGPEG